jgi:hypothetical protein
MGGRGGGEQAAAGLIRHRGHAGPTGGREAAPPHGRPTGGSGDARKAEGGADGWGQGRGERLTGGNGQGKLTEKQCSIFQIQKLLLPGLQDFPKFY